MLATADLVGLKYVISLSDRAGIDTNQVLQMQMSCPILFCGASIDT